MQLLRSITTRYAYNKTIPQTVYSKQDIVLAFPDGKKKAASVDTKRTTRTKLGLSSGKSLPVADFFDRKQYFDEDMNVLKADYEPYKDPFVKLIRDDLWVLDPMALHVVKRVISDEQDDQIPDSLNLLPV